MPAFTIKQKQDMRSLRTIIDIHSLPLVCRMLRDICSENEIAISNTGVAPVIVQDWKEAKIGFAVLAQKSNRLGDKMYRNYHIKGTKK